MKSFHYLRASEIASACASAAQPTAKFIAGGTNLVDLMKLQIETPAQLVDITRLPLDRIEDTAEGGLRIGALVSNSAAAADMRVRRRYPVLAQAILADTFPPEKAKALLDRLEIHYTPKHASWLNIAEIELSVLARQGLEHNIATVDDLCEQVQDWQDYRNHQMATVHWQFTTADARIKLQRLYPTIQEKGQKKASNL